MLAAFGNHADGQLGLGGLEDVQVVSPSYLKNYEYVEAVSEVACGYQHSLFLLKDGSVCACGNNDCGQLGRDEGPRTKLGLVAELQGIKVYQVSCGNSHSVALTDDGHLFAWGSNEFGQLGVGPRCTSSGDPTEINLTHIIQVASGGYHNLALASDGKVFVWGRNNCSQLGLRTTMTEYSPVELKELNGLPIRQLNAGKFHSVILSLSGAVYAWGNNEFGQLGIGGDDSRSRSFPHQAESLRSLKVIYVQCGDSHTAALTKEGRLFTFGAGTYGQLGHGAQKDESMPRQVFELTGCNIISVACGRCHTLALDYKGKLYAFGLGGSGQLGLNGKGTKLTPTMVKLNDGNLVLSIFAGGDHSFVLCSKPDIDNNVVKVSSSARTARKRIRNLSVERLNYLFNKNVDSIAHEFETLFSNASCLNYSFLRKDHSHYNTNGENSGVNMDEVMKCFEMIDCSEKLSKEDSEKLNQTISSCLERKLLLECVAKKSHWDYEMLRIFITLPWCSSFSNPEKFATLHLPFAQALLALQPDSIVVIEKWWSSFEARHFNRVLRVFKQVISHILKLPVESGTDFNAKATNNLRQRMLQASLKILSKLKEVNVKTKKLGFGSFYVDEFAEGDNLTMLQRDYFGWIQKSDKNQFFFCDYPFVFNAAVKVMLLETDAHVQMQIMLNQTVQWNLQSLAAFSLAGSNIIPQKNPFLVLNVSRDNIVADTVQQLMSLSPVEFKKPLKVEIRGEEAEDFGGVRKEFFMLLFQELLNAKYGMFVEYEESRTLWFADTMFVEPYNYTLVGILCGLAIYNSVIVALPFPLAMYKKLLKHPVTLDDLKEISPTEGRSLEALLDYENDDFVDVFCLTFEITVAAFDITRKVELKAGGSQIVVDKSNRHEYVELYVDYKFNESVKTQFEAFVDGFSKVVTSHILNFFQPQELMEMIEGNENYNWDEFEKNTQYKGEYWRYHPTIKLFWEVFHNFTINQKKKFLLFLTGCDRVPLLGMKEPMIIQPTTGGDKYFPVAHTCFNLLDFPKYSDEKTLRAHLLEAIEHTQGFSLV